MSNDKSCQMISHVKLARLLARYCIWKPSPWRLFLTPPLTKALYLTYRNLLLSHPLYKQGLRNEVSNYRPISILLYFSKLLEKIMYSRLYSYIEKSIYYTNISTGFDLAIPRHCPSSVYMITFQLLLTEVNILWGFSLMLLRPLTL